MKTINFLLLSVTILFIGCSAKSSENLTTTTPIETHDKNTHIAYNIWRLDLGDSICYTNADAGLACNKKDENFSEGFILTNIFQDIAPGLKRMINREVLCYLFIDEGMDCKWLGGVYQGEVSDYTGETNSVLYTFKDFQKHWNDEITCFLFWDGAIDCEFK